MLHIIAAMKEGVQSCEGRIFADDKAFTMELTGPANVTNAVALNNVVRSSARAFGPVLGED